MKELKRVVLFANSTKASVDGLVEDMCAFFEERGIQTCVLHLSSTNDDSNIDVPDADLAISLGGDGTVLTCAAALKGRDIPIMAVNLGTFGYITETSAYEYKDVFEDYIGGRTCVLERMMLHAKVLRGGHEVFSSTALNDMTVCACAMSKLVNIRLKIDRVLAADLKADGLIVATPTGSTAYSLAAGGPILDASLNAIIVNPICPFAMSVRPLVVNDSSVLSLEVPSQRTSIAISSDGHEMFELREGDVVVIERSPCNALFVANRRRNFIEVLRDKLGWAGAFNA